MNYQIIGSDGKTYGPVTAEQIREWIAQGRVDDRSPVFVNGASEWTYVGMLPEFAKAPASPPTAVAPFPAVVPTLPKTNSFAIAGLVCGLLSWCCCGCCPFSVFGLIFSLIALVQISASPATQTGRGLALAGLILSAASVLFALGFGLLQLVLQPANVAWHVGRI